jgi:hypothetical protein
MVRATSWFYISLAFVLPVASAAAPVTVSPSKTSVRAGATKQFTAKLQGVSGDVAWTVNGVAGGNATVGTISATGLYTAPLVNPATPLTVRATAGTPPVFADAAVTWMNPVPSIASLSPPAVNIGTFSVTIHGKGFVGASQVLLNGSPVTTTFASSTAVTFQTTISSPQSVAVAVTNPDPGGASSGKRTLNVMAEPTITLSPSAPKIRLGATVKFHAGVSNAVD